MEQHSWAEDKVTVRLLDQKLQICCKVEEVWLAELQGTTSQVPAYRPVSRNIDVPKRFVGVVRVIGTGWGVVRGMWGSQVPTRRDSGAGYRRGTLSRKCRQCPFFSITLSGLECMCFGESINSAHHFLEEETGTSGLNPVLVLILYRVEKVVLALWPKQTLL